MARLISFCGSVGKNTGGIDCDAQLTNPIKFLLGGAKFTPTEQLTEASMKAAILNRLGRANGDSEKLYPFAAINAVTRNTAQDTVETAASGYQRTLRTAPDSYTFDQWTVGVNQQASFIDFNNATLPIFVFTDTGQFTGRIDGDGNFVGSKAQINTKGAGFGTFATGANTQTAVNFVDPNALTKSIAIFDFDDLQTEDLEGLLDAKVLSLAAATGNAYKIGLVIPNKVISKQQDLYKRFPTELAVVGAWRGFSSTGALVNPTTVAQDAALGGWTVTFGSPVVRIDTATPPALALLNVKGIEGLAYSVPA